MTATAAARPQRSPETPWEAEQRRARERANQRRRRARLAGRVAQAGPPRRPFTLTATTAACNDADPRLFFGPDFETAGPRRRRVAAAKAVCMTCPIRAACLAAAYGRWQAGLPARNQFERDAYRAIENDVEAGDQWLTDIGKRAAQAEADRAAEPTGLETGQ